jgi:hypothetical protein
MNPLLIALPRFNNETVKTPEQEDSSCNRWRSAWAVAPVEVSGHDRKLCCHADGWDEDDDWRERGCWPGEWPAGKLHEAQQRQISAEKQAAGPRAQA